MPLILILHINITLQERSILIYSVYKITNTINNKIYVGVHKTNNLNDSYFGSGKAIISAIQKYGKEKFTKSILFEFNNETEAYSKEAQLVNSDFVKSRTTYNMCPGGKGGSGNTKLYGKFIINHINQNQFNKLNKMLSMEKII